MSATSQPGPSARDGGFTLIELLIVLAIIALILQVVFVNIGALIPSKILDNEAATFRAQYEQLRGEARLQGKRYKLQIDMDRHRWRTVIPAEERLSTNQPPPEELVLEWTAIDERAQYSTYAVAGGEPVHHGIVDIVIDAYGFSADQSLSFKLKEDPEMIWTVQIKGLAGDAVIVKSTDKREATLESLTEAHF